MNKHLKYLRYVLRHKWFVLLAGLRTGAPLWRLVIHDWSKFLPSEWFAYADYFYGDGGQNHAAFNRAWLHHQHLNPHHWQHWILNLDDGGFKLLPMPEPLVREMVADWMGAGRAINGDGSIEATREWYRYKPHMKAQMHHETRELVERLLECGAPVPAAARRSCGSHGTE